MSLFHHDPTDPAWHGAPPYAIKLRDMVSLILTNQGKIMSDLTDLQSAITDLGTALTANNAEIEKLLTKIATPGLSSADVQAAVTSIRSLIASNTAEVTKAQAAAP